MSNRNLRLRVAAGLLPRVSDFVRMRREGQLVDSSLSLVYKVTLGILEHG